MPLQRRGSLVCVLVVAACGGGGGRMDAGAVADAGSDAGAVPDAGTHADADTDAGSGTDGGGDVTPRMSLVLRSSDATSARTASLALDTGVLTIAPMDLPDADAVPVHFGATDGILSRTTGQLGVLSADQLSIVRTIDTNDPGAAGPHASNPQAVISISPNKAYVTRGGLNSILVIDPTLEGAAAQLRTIDLSAFQLPGDTDGHVDAGAAIVVGTRAYVALGRYFPDATGAAVYLTTSLLAVIDTATDSLVDVDPLTPGVQCLTLHYQGPIDLANIGGNVIVGCEGVVPSHDAGIEVVDPGTLTTRAITAEHAVSGDVLGVEAVGDRLVVEVGFIDALSQPNRRLVTVDPVTGEVALTHIVELGVEGMAAAGGDVLAMGLKVVGDHRVALYDVATSADVTPAAAPADYGMMRALGGIAPRE